MRKLLLASLLLVPACGSGDNAVVPRIDEDDLHYQQLLQACRDAEKKIPGLSNWARVLEEITYQNDGSLELFALAEEYAKSLPPLQPVTTADEFIELMEESRRTKDSEPGMTAAELSAVLAQTQAFVDRFAKLRKYDSLAVLAPREGSSQERDLALARLLDAVGRRPRLLVLAARLEEAESELVTYLEILQRLDRDSRLRSRDYVNSEVCRLLIELAEGHLRPLATSERMQEALDPLFEFGNIGRKRAWLRELKYMCWYYLNATKEQVFQHLKDTRRNLWEGLLRSLRELKYAVELATTFEMNAPDVLSKSDMDTAFHLADPHYEYVWIGISGVAWGEARLQAAWLGHRLYLENVQQGLLGRKADVEALLPKYQGAAIKWEALTVQVGVDPEFEPSKWAHAGGFIPVVTIRFSDRK